MYTTSSAAPHLPAVLPPVGRNLLLQPFNLCLCCPLMDTISTVPPWAVHPPCGHNPVVQPPSTWQCCHPVATTSTAALHLLGSADPCFTELSTAANPSPGCLVDTIQYCPPPSFPGSAAPWLTQPVLHPHGQWWPLVDTTWYCSPPTPAVLPPGGHNPYCTPMDYAAPMEDTMRYCNPSNTVQCCPLVDP